MSDVLVDIIVSCIDIVKHVREFYTEIEKRTQDPKLKDFWRSLAGNKEAHLGYLHKVLVYARQGVILQGFSRPFDSHEDLQKIKRDLLSFIDDSLKKGTQNDLFLAAYYCEFQLIHEAFVTFYQMELPKTDRTPADDYSAQITRFVKIINKVAENAPTFMVLGDMLRRLWKYARGVAEGSVIDSLTGVLNRQGFFHKVASWLELIAREKRTMAVFIIDVDELKRINEEHSSKTGDKVLRFVAKELNHLCRKSDLLGRYSGEEFIVFLPSIDKENLDAVAERFLKRIDTRSKTAEIIEEGITISIGGVYGKISGKNIMHDFQKYIDSADTLMERKVKKTGGNGYALLKMN